MGALSFLYFVLLSFTVGPNVEDFKTRVPRNVYNRLEEADNKWHVLIAQNTSFPVGVLYSINFRGCGWGGVIHSMNINA